MINGWAGPELLETYSDERAPVGQAVVARANQSRVDYGPINAAFRTEGEADPVTAGLAMLRDPSPAGVSARQKMIDAVEFKNTEFNAQGTELNQRYDSTAVLPDADGGEEVFLRDRLLYLQATTRPGAKVPHVWLVDEHGYKVSTLDVTQRGKFSLVTGLSGQAWAAAADKLDLPFLRTIVIGANGTEDAYHDWSRVRQVNEAGAVLVRPDGYVAWRHVGEVWDEEEALHQLNVALERVLNKPC